MNCNGFGWKQSLSNRGIVPESARGNLRKLPNLSARIGGVMAEIRTDHILNTSFESYRYTNRLSIYSY
jgi:hypothetical protein